MFNLTVSTEKLVYQTSAELRAFFYVLKFGGDYWIYWVPPIYSAIKSIEIPRSN
jgi:hypothetical protein